MEISAKVCKIKFGTKMEKMMEKIIEAYFIKSSKSTDSSAKFPPLGPSG